MRHAESVGNVARRIAEETKAKRIEIPCREPDVALSDFGKNQAVALGNYFADFSENETPTVIYSSPFIRTSETTRILMAHSGINPPKIRLKFDERLREREFGIFDCLTKRGAMEKHPDLCDLRERLGKFYFRPPAGENWADVVQRLRTFVETDLTKLIDESVLIVTHEVVIRCFRYILEEMSEAEILEIDRASDVENGAITKYEFDELSRKPVLKIDNFVPFLRINK